MARRYRSNTQRRRTGWTGGLGGNGAASSQATLTSITATGTSILGDGLQSEIDGLTIVRIRGLLNLQLSSASAAYSGYDGAFGIAVVSGDAFAVGTTAIPKPIEDSSWDGWMWHQYFSLKNAGTYTTATSSNIQNLEIDCKAMRKAPAPCALSLFHNAGALAGSPSSIKICGHLRWLIKE